MDAALLALMVIRVLIVVVRVVVGVTLVVVVCVFVVVVLLFGHALHRFLGHRIDKVHHAQRGYGAVHGREDVVHPRVALAADVDEQVGVLDFQDVPGRGP